MTGGSVTSFASVSRTHVGRVRTVNEDRLLDRPDRRLWAVADGMGGHSAGDVAAQIAVDALDALADAPEPVSGAMLIGALRDANTRIRAGQQGESSGTTIVALLAAESEAMIAWAGDSRAYLVREGDARLLTHDHSLVQEMVDAGVLTEGQARFHPRANIITRALGVAAEVEIDVARLSLSPGDRVLLCSDGLYRSLCPDDLTERTDIAALADRLLLHSLQRDGSDNSSLVLIEFS